MPRAVVATTNPDRIEVEYETFGSPDDPALLLVMGFTAQLIAWEVGWCEQLAAHGRYVVRFDNRDCGLSTHFDGLEVNLLEIMTAGYNGEPIPPTPYSLSDMAADAVGLLDELGIERAHVAGASMGGMIGQTMAIEHPQRCITLTSIMSSTGDPRAGEPTAEALAYLLSPPPTDREAYVARADGVAAFASKRHFDPERARARAGAAFDRAFYPEGAGRQLAAVYASGDRTEQLHEVPVPTLVIHGRDDNLIPPAGGTLTAEAIPGAHLLLISDMGHDLPEPLWPLMIETMVTFQDLATRSTANV